MQRRTIEVISNNQQGENALSARRTDARGCDFVAPHAPPPARSAALPCLYSNNSTGTDAKWPELSPYHKRAAEALHLNVAHMIDHYGLNNVGFLTLTFPEDLSPEEAQRRFNSLASHFLRKEFEAYLAVVEFTKRGRSHFHLLVACDEDIRTGFDFAAQRSAIQAESVEERRRLTKQYAESASPFLRSMWSKLREKSGEYGFGRHELTPVKSTGLALAYYLAKYISKSVLHRPPEACGKRLVRYGLKEHRAASANFQWLTDRSTLWRRKVGCLAAALGALDLDDLKLLCGSHWAFQLKDHIMALTDLTTYANDKQAIADGWCPTEFNGVQECVEVEAVEQGRGYEIFQPTDCADDERLRIGATRERQGITADQLARAVVQRNPISHVIWQKFKAQRLARCDVVPY